MNQSLRKSETVFTTYILPRLPNFLYIVQPLHLWWLRWERICLQCTRRRFDFLEKGITTYSSFLAWRIPWTEKPGRVYDGVAKSQTRLTVCIGKSLVLITGEIHCFLTVLKTDALSWPRAMHLLFVIIVAKAPVCSSSIHLLLCLIEPDIRWSGTIWNSSDPMAF